MGSLEMDGEAEDPFAEEETEETDETNIQDSPDRESTVAETPGQNHEHDQGRGSPDGHGVSDTSQTDSAGSANREVGIGDLQVGEQVDPSTVAQALASGQYKRENPPVPYATWRDNVNTDRGKMTIDINKDLNRLVKQVEREFEQQYDATFHKADIRELALAYGLLHVDELFSMAEEWGLQY